VTGTIRLARSFAVRFTSRDTGQACSRSSGAGAISASAVRASTAAQLSQRSKASGVRMTGMRSCKGASVPLARVVTIAAVSTSSPFAPAQVS
jgi:hypothetical protein